jgi:hypothetical protein
MKIEILISLDTEGKTDSWVNWCSRFYRFKQPTSSTIWWWKRRRIGRRIVFTCYYFKPI